MSILRTPNKNRTGRMFASLSHDDFFLSLLEISCSKQFVKTAYSIQLVQIRRLRLFQRVTDLSKQLDIRRNRCFFFSLLHHA